MATTRTALSLIAACLFTGWGQPPPAGSVLFPNDRGLLGFGIARSPSIALERALEDASANRFLSVRFETFMQGTGYAYSFDEFAIEPPASMERVSLVDSMRRPDGLHQIFVAYPDSLVKSRDTADMWIVRGAYRAIVGDEYRSYVLSKRHAVRAAVEARYKSVKVMDQMTMEKLERVAYISTKAIIRNIRVIDVDHRSDSTVVRIAIHPDDVFFYE